MHAPRTSLVSANKEGLVSVVGASILPPVRKGPCNMCQATLRSIFLAYPLVRFCCRLRPRTSEECRKAYGTPMFHCHAGTTIDPTQRAMMTYRTRSPKDGYNTGGKTTRPPLNSFRTLCYGGWRLGSSPSPASDMGSLAGW